MFVYPMFRLLKGAHSNFAMGAILHRCVTLRKKIGTIHLLNDGD